MHPYWVVRQDHLEPAVLNQSKRPWPGPVERQEHPLLVLIRNQWKRLLMLVRQEWVLLGAPGSEHTSEAAPGSDRRSEAAPGSERRSAQSQWELRSAQPQ